MYVCICKGVTDGDIMMAAEQGVTSMSQLRDCTGVASQCAKCARIAKSILTEAKQQGDSGVEFYAAG